MVTLRSGLEVIEIGAIQKKLGCGFLFAFYSYYGAILYRLQQLMTPLAWPRSGDSSCAV